MFRRFLPLLALCSCAHLYDGPPPLTQDTANFFSRAESEENGGSIVLDLDALRTLGFLKPLGPGQHSVVSDIVAFTLPTIAGELKDDPAGPLLARTTVLFALFREWDGWPRVQRLGVVLPKTDDPEGAADRLIGLMAIGGERDTSHVLLDALAAADRATGSPVLVPVSGDLCLLQKDRSPMLCIRAGPGFLAVATPTGLAELPDLLAGPRLPQPAVAILRARLNVPSLGKGFLAVEPLKGVRIRAAFASKQPGLTDLIEQKAQEALAQLDARHAAQESLIGPVLAQTQAGLAKDPNAPATLKAASARLSIDSLLDPEGTWAAIRKSTKLTRTDDAISVQAVIPEATVTKVAQEGSTFTTFAAVGLLSAIAIPSYVRYQCTSKQAEASTTLLAAAAAARHARETKSPIAGLSSLGFQAPADSRFTYCLGSECVKCRAENCYVPPDDQNPCLRLAKKYAAETDPPFLMCAVADLDGSVVDGDLDVWVVADDGVPRHLQDDCK